MNWKNFFDLWETYCKKAVRKRDKATEKDEGWHYYHSGFYEPYIGNPADCSAVCIIWGVQYKISYLKWLLKNYDSYRQGSKVNKYWLPENKNTDYCHLNSRRIWANELNQAVNGADKLYDKKPFFVNYAALYDYYFLDPKTKDKFSKRDFLDYLLSAYDKADLHRVILCTNADLRGFFRRLGYKPIFQVANGVEKEGKFTLPNWPISEGTFIRTKYKGLARRTYIGYLIDPGDGTEPYKILLSYAKLPRYAPASKFREVEAELIKNHFHQ